MVFKKQVGKIWKTAPILFLLLLTGMSATSCGSRSAMKQADKAIDTAYRMPVTTDDSPWKIVRGIYAFGPRYVIMDSVTQEKRHALNHLGGTTISGLLKADEEGPYFSDTTRGKECETQRNFFTAVVLEAGATKETGFLDDFGDFHSIESFARRAARMLDVEELTANEDPTPGQNGNELGWTLILLANSNMVITKWENYKGKMTATEDILKIALSRPVGWGADNGFIEQLGIASILRAYRMYRLEEEMGLYRAKLKRGETKEIPAPALDRVPLDGVWAEARDHVDGVVETLKKNQINDGGFSSAWSAGKSRPDEADETVLYTGYALHFLALALPENRLDEPWVRKAMIRLCSTIQQNRFHLYEKTWALSQAAHGLRSYRDRMRNRGKPFVVEPEFESDELPPTWENRNRKR